MAMLGMELVVFLMLAFLMKSLLKRMPLSQRVRSTLVPISAALALTLLVPARSGCITCASTSSLTCRN